MCALRLGVDVPGMVRPPGRNNDLVALRRESLFVGFWSLSQRHSGQPDHPDSRRERGAPQAPLRSLGGSVAKPLQAPIPSQ